MTAVAEGLGDLAGARHVAVASNDRGGTALVTADVRTDAADAALALLARLGVPADDVVFARLLAVETRASSAVGVAISVTTVPAVAYLGVAAGAGERGHTLSGLAVLSTNVAMMLIGGSAALALQRMIALRRARTGLEDV
jgi:hypothetical protein